MLPFEFCTASFLKLHEAGDNKCGAGKPQLSNRVKRRCSTVTAIVAISAATTTTALSQVPSLAPGDIVRATFVDSASNGLWATGTVLRLSRDSLLLADTDGSSLIRLNESIRIQVNRGKKRQTALGGVAGCFAGALAGVMSMRMNQDDSRREAASLGPMVQYGALGTLVGAIVGSRIGPTRWVDVPVPRSTSLAAAPPHAGVAGQETAQTEITVAEELAAGAHDASNQPEQVDSSSSGPPQDVTLLNPVTVEAPRVNERLDEVGFLSRARALAGTFLTREDIVKQNPENTADLLRRIPGFSVTSTGFVSSPREAILCSGVDYFIDGVHAQGAELAFVLPNAIAGMEVYNSSTTVPMRFHVAGNPRCGVVLIWTVDGGRSP